MGSILVAIAVVFVRVGITCTRQHLIDRLVNIKRRYILNLRKLVLVTHHNVILHGHFNFNGIDHTQRLIGRNVLHYSRVRRIGRRFEHVFVHRLSKYGTRGIPLIDHFPQYLHGIPQIHLDGDFGCMTTVSVGLALAHLWCSRHVRGPAALDIGIGTKHYDTIDQFGSHADRSHRIQIVQQSNIIRTPIFPSMKSVPRGAA
mmetsp:Transcript_3203/g.7086  ORF Transcript_3203/g.7086 Transcript_3203/m.7086 type:complete len:201 (+) Transcript_3203:2346-2948(+)